MIRPVCKSAPGLALALLLGGCAVGPDFHRPPPPAVDTYRPVADTRGGLPLDPGATVTDTWWYALGSPQLNALVARGLANSPDVAAAQDRLRSAQAQLRAGYGPFFPQVDAAADGTRQKYSPSRVGQTGAPEVFSLFTPGVAVTYVIDLFGANRRLVEGLRATAVAQAQTLRATRLTLAGNIATTVIARAAFDDEVEAWRAIVADGETQLAAAQARTHAGTQPLSAELALAQSLENARTGLKAAEVKAGQADDLLAVLLGEAPSKANLPAIALTALRVPSPLPLRLPADLVRQRPDILVAEAAAHNASAQIGVATAAMLPQITLSAGTGSSANSLATVFGTGTGVWNYGAGITTPLFAGGSLINKRNAARADYQTAMDVWRQTVITAFGQVADLLTANAGDGASDAAQARASDDAEMTFDLAKADRIAGLISAADLAATRVQWQTARIAALNAHATHLQDVIALMWRWAGVLIQRSQRPDRAGYPCTGQTIRL